MLKGIPSILSPQLMLALMEMGHGDEIVLADAHFPAYSCGQRVIRHDGCSIPALLDAILKFFPMDTHEAFPVVLMNTGSAEGIKPTVWVEYTHIIEKQQADPIDFTWLDRREFYERSKKAYAIVSTGEKEQYSNMIIRKGVVLSD